MRRMAPICLWSLWHSQANESALAHYPGSERCDSSTPADAAGLLWTAMHAEDPVIFSLPSICFGPSTEYTSQYRAVSAGQSAEGARGSESLGGMGNTIEKSL